ncbi:MAG: erythromycin esterase family protein [Armatimonadetes bacterium]|nr:MAG: erythromycin esterase family protein [Armatimonadota bacterium]
MNLFQQIQSLSSPLKNTKDIDPLLEQIGKSKIVLLGEASHGTHEYYQLRVEISKRLIIEKGFNFIAVEGDWPDCYKINQYVKGFTDAGPRAYEVLFSFNRWPTWMWANVEMVYFIEWLREFNLQRPKDKKVGFYGLDVYSLWESLNVISGYLQKVDLQAAESIEKAYRCFEPFSQDVQQYALTTAFVPGSCEKEVVEMLVSLRKQLTLLKNESREELFNVEQNAQVVINAEKYYRTMLKGDVSSWNIRDEAMTQTLERLLDFHEDLLEKKLKPLDFERAGMWPKRAKGIVWAHNTHLGDARATDMKETKMINLGELIKKKHGQDVVYSVGFSSYQGSVIASDEWGALMKRKKVDPARKGSWEDLFHQIDKENRLVMWRDVKLSREMLLRRGLRAIGVVYHPEHESGNYIPTILPEAFDAFIYLEKTKALSPLHMKGVRDKDFPETFPFSV